MASKAVVLVSGGLDSATTLAIARAELFTCHALSFDYGQRHRAELDAARAVARSMGLAGHVVLKIDLRQFGGSALTSKEAVPKSRSMEEIGSGIPITYVPARNTIFLAFALGYAEVLGAFDIFIGANCLDYSGYPDCRPEYLAAFEQLASLATKAGVEGQGRFRVHAPLLHLRKDEIVRRGMELGVDFGLTWSCYDPTPDGLACGACDSCQLRLDAFARAGAADPIRYAKRTAG
jgi:7-cyano-7-deazaguanine synthase